MFGEVAIDGGLQVDDGMESAASEALAVSVEKTLSTALSHDAEVGVKWKVQRGCRASQARTLGCL